MAEPIQLHCDLVVDPAREAELLENFHSMFRPVIGKQPGFVDAKLLKLRNTRMTEAEGLTGYRLLISFETEELRKAWVASEDHQRVWPAIDRTLTGTKLSGAVYDVL